MSSILSPICSTAVSATYRAAVKPYLFRQDPEAVHEATVKLGYRLSRSAAARAVVRFCLSYAHPSLEQTLLGVSFKNPMGLAAGFDKDGYLIPLIASLGFGFIEIGSVTGEPCLGNPRPRLWRLPEVQALVVHFGLKSEGAERVASRLRGQVADIPVGVSIAKTNSAQTVDDGAAVADYLKAYRLVGTLGSYVTVNISCPNAHGGQPFSDPARLDSLLATLRVEGGGKPLLLKLPPDLELAQLDAVLEVAQRHGVAGYICTNLTKRRDLPLLSGLDVPGPGGVSGKVIEPLADNVVRYVYRAVGRSAVVVGCGGVFSAEDAYRKIRLGASLVQLITGLVYRGPQLVAQINRGLVRLLRRDGFSSVSEAVGVDAQQA